MAQPMDQAMPDDTYRMVLGEIQRCRAAVESGDESARIQKNEIEFLRKDGTTVPTATVTRLVSDVRGKGIAAALVTSVLRGMAEVYDLAQLAWTANSASAAAFTIDDPELLTGIGATGSFGQSVSINDEWIAVGAPFHSGSNGLVYMYQNLTVGNNYSWSLYQVLQPETPIVGGEFGLSLKLNKAPNTQSLVVGGGPGGMEAAAAPTGPVSPLVAVGRGIFTTRGCIGCHGSAGMGTAAAPSLVGVTRKFHEADLIALLHNPSPKMRAGRMPVVDAPPNEMSALIAYLGVLGTSAANVAPIYGLPAQQQDAGNRENSSLTVNAGAEFACYAGVSQPLVLNNNADCTFAGTDVGLRFKSGRRLHLS